MDELLYTQEDINEWIRTCEELQEKIKEQEEIIEELSEYKKLEEQGLLKRLPCKEGTIVYTIYKEDWTAEYTMVASRVQGFSDCGDGIGLRFVLPFGSPAVSLVGDRIFFSPPEAEKKLEELKEKKNESNSRRRNF